MEIAQLLSTLLQSHLQRNPEVIGLYRNLLDGAGERLGDPYGIRTRVAGVKGRCPRPLDERTIKGMIVLSSSCGQIKPIFIHGCITLFFWAGTRSIR